MIGHSLEAERRGAVCQPSFLAWILCLFTAIALISLPSPSWSQEETGAVSGLSPELQALVRAAEAEGATVLVIGGTPEPAAAAAPQEASLQDKMQRAGALLRQRLAAMALAAPGYPNRIDEAFEKNGSGAWPLIAAALAVLALGIGYLVFRLFNRWAHPYFGYLFNPEPTSRAEKICYLVATFLIRAVAVFLQLATAVIVLLIIDYGTPAAQDLQLRILIVFGIWRVSALFFAALLGSDAPSHRMLRIDDEDAIHLKRHLSLTMFVAFTLLHTRDWLAGMGVGADLSGLSFIVSSFIAAFMLTVVAFIHRRAIAEAIMGPASESGMGARILARVWPILAGIYFLVAWGISSLRTLLGFPNSTFLVGSPFLALLGALAAYGLAIMLLDWLAPPSKDEKPKTESSEAEASSAEAATPNPAEVLQEVTVTAGDGEHIKPEKPKPPRLKTFRDLAERAISIVIFTMMVASVFMVWGVDVFSGTGLLGTLWELVFIVFMAYLAYMAVRILIDRKVEEEGGNEEVGGGDEGGHGGRSRLATLLPLFRNFLLAVIVTMALMIGLSQLGVDIAPLFAGAGVIGLAIGFGAQTLIKDIFSGAFFLMDDAFRVGEYIDIGSVKGTVEKISVRSMQLRHQLGTLVTVPFGEIQHLSNYSRDWVIMKLPLRLTYDTDVNKVNKLIKNLGKELLNHELIGKSFIEPLKSQGVFMMEDSAMIIRVKFKTRPGEQFQARKIIYAEIRSLFEREGIQFASREVKVRLDESAANRPLSEADKAKIGAAVRPILDAETEQGGGGPAPEMR